MSVMSYNGINFGQLRTEYMKAEPVLDALGNVDPLFTHVMIEITSIMHPNVTASNIVPGAGPVVNGVAIPQGDRAGLSLDNLRQALLQQRKPLIYQIGPDNVIVSPPIVPDAFLGQKFLDRDCKEGPHVIDCRVAQIEGDFSFFIYFKVETWITGFSNVLLSNRWAMTHDVNLYGLTTRYVTGQATIRADAIPLRATSVDDFRQSLFLPVPPNFRRERINCQVNPDGTVLNYQIVDKETGLALGPNSVAVTIHGNATAGTEFEIKNVRDSVGKFVETAGQVINLDITGLLGNILKSAVPITKANVLIRVQGNRGASRKTLLNLATSIAADRMGTIFIASAYATQGLDSEKTPWVEVRIEFFPGVVPVAGAFFNPGNFSLQMNVKDDMSGGPNIGGFGGQPIVPPITSNNVAGVNPPLPSDNNTRGSYIGRMAVQTFAAAGQVPNPPPAPADRQVQQPF